MDDNRAATTDDDDLNEADSVDLPSATIIGANINSINTGTFPGAVVAPAAETAARESEDEAEVAEEAREARNSDETA